MNYKAINEFGLIKDKMSKDNGKTCQHDGYYYFTKKNS